MRTLYLSIIALTLFGTTSFAADPEFPKLKSGLWEITTEMPMIPKPMTASFCIDEATQEKLFTQATHQQSACQTPSISKDGDTYIVKTSCEFHGRKSEIENHITFDGDSSYSSVMNMEMPGTAREMKSNGKFIGSCREGQKPGDIEVAGGVLSMDSKQIDPKAIAEMAKQMAAMKQK